MKKLNGDLLEESSTPNVIKFFLIFKNVLRAFNRKYNFLFECKGNNSVSIFVLLKKWAVLNLH